MKILLAPRLFKRHLQGAISFCVLLLILIFSPIVSSSQNLIPNPGFEDLFINEEFQWIQPINQYYHWERDEAGLGFAHEGEFFNGICMYNWHDCEYLHIKLLQPLEADSTYHLSMWYRLANFKAKGHQYLSKIGWYFGDQPKDTRHLQIFNESPQASFQIPDSVKKTDWNQASTTYTATGNESFVTIGYFPSLFWNEEEQNEYTSDEDSTLIALANKSKGKQKRSKKKNKYKEKDLAEFRKLINEKYKIEQAVMKPVSVEGNFTLRFYFDDFCIAKIDSLGTFDCAPQYQAGEIVEGQKFRLNRIYFESGQATLLDSSFYELDRLVFFLGLKPEINIKIIGHTDDEGDDRDNLILSRDRASAVREYLISKDIDPSRLTSDGMGESQPIAENDTEEGKQINRRVEFEIR